jgi:hypothetical protein
MNELTTLSAILILATLVEALVEYLVKPLFGPPIFPVPAGADKRSPSREASGPPDACPDALGEDPAKDLLMRYSAATLGVLLCLAYQADLLVLANLHAPRPWIGFVITGILLGRGANFVHDFTARWFARGPS